MEHIEWVGLKYYYLKLLELKGLTKKILFLKFVRFLLKKSTIIHVTDSLEQSESIFFFPTFKHIPILDFPPLRIKEFPQRTKESGEINLLYIGRIDGLKNLHSVLVALKNLSTFLRNSALNSTKKIKLTMMRCRWSNPLLNGQRYQSFTTCNCHILICSRE